MLLDDEIENVYNTACYYNVSNSEHVFFDIIDMRNGEIYSFYRKKESLDKDIYEFYDNHQEYSVYSIEKTVYDNDLFRHKILKERPKNPFEKYHNYKITFKNCNYYDYGRILSIELVD